VVESQGHALHKQGKEVVDYCHETLLQAPEALAYFESRGAQDLALPKAFWFGFR
jgi:hypothetical protein